MRLSNRLSRLSYFTSAVAAVAGLLFFVPGSSAQEQTPDHSDRQTSEPVFRVSKLPESPDNPVTTRSAALPAAPETDVRPLNIAPTEVNNNENVDNASTRPATATLPPELAPRGAAIPDAPADAAASGSTAPVAPAVAPHPLDRAITMAYEQLDHIEANISDYTAIMRKRERINGELEDFTFMQVKVRNPRTTVSGDVPFSVYMKFLRPRKAAGREVIYVDGWNDGQLIAHESGMLGFKRFYLDPTGSLAMRGARNPITKAGIENLVRQLIEKAERDRQVGECIVEYREDGAIGDRACTVIELLHPDRHPDFEFHKAEVFIDQELNIPVRYAAYGWPAVPGGEPQLLEEYTYFNITLNVGLTDEDFNPDNPNYEFPAR